MEVVGGADGTLSEAEARRTIDDLRATDPGAGLAGAVFGSLLAEAADVPARYRAATQGGPQGLATVADVLEARSTPAEARDFKGALIELARHVAGEDPDFPTAEETAYDMCSTLLRVVPDDADPATGPELRSRFSSDEWAQLQLAPLQVLSRVAAAEGSEPAAGALTRVLIRAPREPDPLLRELLFSIAREAPSVVERLDPAAATDERFTELGALLDSRLDAEPAAYFKASLIGLASVLTEGGATYSQAQLDAMTALGDALGR